MSQIEQAAREAHRLVVESPTEDAASFVLEVLGPKLSAFIFDTNPKTVKRWAEGTTPRHEAGERLQTLHMILRLLLAAESRHTVRAWFVGLNPQLDDESPARAIREGRERQVLTAAKSFLAGG